MEKPTYLINGKIYKRLNAVYNHAQKNNLTIKEMYRPNLNRQFFIVKVDNRNQLIKELQYLLNN